MYFEHIIFFAFWHERLSTFARIQQNDGRLIFYDWKPYLEVECVDGVQGGLDLGIGGYI